MSVSNPARLPLGAALVWALAGCATPPAHYPSETAETFVGKSLQSLELRWSVPLEFNQVNGESVASWEFDQYNYAGCQVTVRTDRNGIIRKVTWSKGCGPKAGKKKAAAKAR